MKVHTVLTALFLVIIFFGCKRKPVLELQQGENFGEFHHAHKGEVLFMSGYVPFDSFGESDILSTFELNESSNLNIRVFVEEPLTQHLARIAPELSVQELCDQGNYQFTFLVDGVHVYEENLNVGAGSCSQKNTATVFSVPLASTDQEDSWGRFLWQRFMFRGGGDIALHEAGLHTLKIELRPYIDLADTKVGPIIAQGQVELNIVRHIAAADEIRVQAIAPMDDWEVSNERFDEEKIEALNKKIIEGDFKDITSIAVIKNGQLLIEEYFNGTDRSSLHDPRSVGKTFASTTMGIAIEEGHISGVGAKLGQFYNLKNFDNYSSEKEKVTIESLLMMHSGFDGNDSDYDSPGNEENMYPTDDWVKFALDLKVQGTQTEWSYFTAGVVILGDILNSAVPQGLDKYADEKLFKPLGIRDYKWQYTPTNIPNTAGGIRLRTIDFAKYGQLYKNGGIWKGKQILSKEWVSESLSKKVPRPETKTGHYGYLFWNDIYTINGVEYEVSFCTGNGGNKIYVFKDIPFVIVVTATAYGRPYAHPQVDKMMEKYILPAIL